MQKQMIDCAEAGLLTERKVFGELNFKEYFSWRIHLLTCRHCERYYRQSMIIHKHLKQLLQDRGRDKHVPDKFKEDWRKAIRKQIEGER